jgi:NitT/TauT family transport system substrate-binding protein
MLAGTAGAGLALASGGLGRAADLKQIVIAEPVHSAGYAPLYVAIDQGLFAKRGLAVSTLTASGGAHVTALVSGQVWGNIGGPESDAMANVGKADPLISVCNVVNRAMNWMMAKKGLAPKSSSYADIAALMKGRKMAFNRYGGTPDLCGRWLLKKIGLDAKTDVTIVNQADSAAGPLMVKSGAVDIAISQEPQITYGKEQGIWDDPFFSFPSLGDYSYSVISVQHSTIAKDPKTVQAFTDAMVEALKLAATNKSVVETVIRKEFPTLPDSGVKGIMDRMYSDHIWSPNGMISQKGFALDMDVVYTTGEFTAPVAFDSVIDMQFVKRSKA